MCPLLSFERPNLSSTKPCSLDDDDDELEGIWQAALEGAQQSKRPDAVRSADLSALVGQRPRV